MSQSVFLVCYNFFFKPTVNLSTNSPSNNPIANKMEPSNNFVITETDQSTHKCTAMLVNFLQQTRKLAIGQCITSPIFEMKCAKIGQSRWMLIVFPAGQYEFEKDSGQLSVYLRMIECEFENEKLLVDVKFFIDSEESFSKIVKASTFQYQNTRTRWVGTNLASKLEFHNGFNSGNLMQDNDLVIGCRMIHSDVECKQTLTVALPSSNASSISVIQSQITGTTSTPSPTIISESSRLQKRKKLRRIFCC